MKITDAPTPIATPFAQNGTRNDIPDADPGFTGDTAGRAAFTTGFPEITMRPIAAGGVPPFGADFNGILYALSNAVRFYGAGGHYKFNTDFATKIGGYPMGATVQATDNMGHWLNVVEANSINPESGLSTGWLPLADHNGTATVTLTASTALTPLQAAKANLRFTGTPTGNVTVTFPAWTKRYSIINDCTGDGSVICTTGNGESISIKNGAKYEVGCDGKNLTISTVNASQVFADANKNISALDAPTVQQLLNALGSAAAHAAGDFDSAGSAKAVQETVDTLAKSLANIAKSGNMADALGTLAIEHGGTGATDAVKVRQNLGIQSAALHKHEDYEVAGTAQNLVDNLTLDISKILRLGIGKQSDSGYITLPYNDNGNIRYIYLQWTWWNGTTGNSGGTGIAEGSSYVSWPVPFPNKATLMLPSVSDVGGSEKQESAWNGGINKSGGTIWFSCRSSSTFVSGNVIAIGW